MTLKSMTGYGKEVFRYESISYLIEIHSVNKKTLDISLLIPKELLFLDLDIRKLLSSEIKRGQLTFKLTKEIDNIQSLAPYDVAALAQYKNSLEHIMAQLGYEPIHKLSFEFLIEQYEKGFKSGKKFDADFHEPFFAAIHKALKHFILSRQEEGEVLKVALLKHLDEITTKARKIQEMTPLIVQDYRGRLEEKLKEMDMASQEMQERLAKEVLFYVDKVDISEEIQRLFSHLDQFKKILHSDEESTGKKLEFILLEMQREAHTLTAKSQMLELINHGLYIKSEIEKIREQLQNLE